MKVMGIINRLNSNLANLVKYIPEINAQDANDIPRYPYISTINPDNAALIGLEKGWYGIIYIPHPSADGYGLQITISYIFGSYVFLTRRMNQGVWEEWGCK